MIFRDTKTLNGYALVLVLWILSALTLMAASFSSSMKTELLTADTLKSTAAAITMAESGIAVAEYMLLSSTQNSINGQPNNTEQNNSWRTHGSVYQLKMGNAQVRVRMLSEAGKINIIFAEPALLRALLAHHASTSNSAEKDPKRIEKWVDAILDWRDKNTTARPNGAEEKDYPVQLKYKPRNNGFKTLEELQMVLGMDTETFANLEPLMTVYSTSSSAQVDKSASAEVLHILPDLNADAVEQFLQARIDSERSGRPLTVPLTSKYINSAEGDTISQSNAVTIEAEARLEDGSTAAINATVVRWEVDPAAPFQTIRWQRKYVKKENSLFSKDIMAQCIVSQGNIAC